MKKIIWNIFVSILLIIAIIGDIKMALNTQKSSINKITEEINTNKPISIMNNINSQDILLKEIKKEGY